MKYFILPTAGYKHQVPFFHPESPQRLKSIENSFNGVARTEGRPATIEELRLCHSQSYIDLVKREINEGKTTLSTGDVEISLGSWEAALWSAGSALKGIELLKEDTQVFVAERPPGHHASQERGMGFCLFNNIALAARHAQKTLGIKRILIVDWDLHHGNGTEDIFRDDKDIFYFSTHQSPFYPGTGLQSNHHLLNIPIAGKPGSRLEILNAFNTRLLPEMARFQPELVLISAGFDAHKLDPLGGLDLETEDYGTLTRIVKKIANDYSLCRILSLLEGGYNPEALAASARLHYEEL